MNLDRHMGEKTSAMLVSKSMGLPFPGVLHQTRVEGPGNQSFLLCSYVRHSHRMLEQYDPDM